MIKIYLDDKRKTPDGFIRTYSVEETIDLIKKNDGNIGVLSLDNDLGVGFQEGREVMKWIEEQAFRDRLKPIFSIILHSGNSVAVEYMRMARHNAFKYWEKHGYDIYE